MLTHLMDASIRSMLLALPAAVALRILRHRLTAAWQHAVWTAVVCGMLALLAFGQALPRIPVALPGRAEVAVTPPAAVASPMTPEPVDDIAAVAPSATMAPSRKPIDWVQMVEYGYAAIALTLLIRFLTGMVLVRRLLAGSRPAAGVLESERITVPITVGWLRPRVVLPAEWREWDEEKLYAVLAHEGAHARRRDGLVAALAAVNRCLFWFHPLAWMLERRLALLAEQSCDESCVAALGDRRRYASLLLEMALVVDGSAGRLRQHALTMAATSHMRQRIDWLLAEGRTFSRGLSRAGWIGVALCGLPVLWSAGAVELHRSVRVRSAVALAIPVAGPAPAPTPIPVVAKSEAPASVPQKVVADAPEVPGEMEQAPAVVTGPEFEVASLKAASPSERVSENGGPGTTSPGQFTCTAIALRQLIIKSWGVKSYEMSGPSSLDSQAYDIAAKIPPGATEATFQLMLQHLLADRLALTVHHESKIQDVYELVLAKGGLKMREAEVVSNGNVPPESVPGGPAIQLVKDKDGNSQLPAGRKAAVIAPMGLGVTQQMARMQQIDDIVRFLSRQAKRPVIDKTGLTGSYDYTLRFLRDGFTPPASTDASLPAPTLVEAVTEQLGLKLESKKGAVDILVVDSFNKVPKE